MDKLAKHDKAKLIDLLSERLAFERAGVKLYDKILSRLREDDLMLPIVVQLEENRAEEKEHEEWLEREIRALGGNAHEETEHVRLVERESAGIEDVVMHDVEPAHLFHALLAAELVDAAGWDLLVDLASEAADEEALRQFQIRKAEEDDHLFLVRSLVLLGAQRDVLGTDVTTLRG